MTHHYAYSGYRNGGISHWMHSGGHVQATRPPPTGSRQYDTVIIGGGYTGLWAAHYLTQLNPEARVAVVEGQHVGYGASGRNAGWLSHLVPGNRAIYARDAAGVIGAIALQRAMVDAVGEVLKVAAQMGIEMDQTSGGNLVIATTTAGMQRLRERRAADLRYGLVGDETTLLTATQARDRINAHGVLGGLYYPVATRIQPAKLVTALAAAVERQGVVIYEGSEVTEVRNRTVKTNTGTLHANKILICTEGYGGPLLGRRRVIPINSSMIVTQPLTDAEWDTVGWSARECFSDAAHTFVYAQRTEDGRIAVGGRGSPYRFASRTGGPGEIPQATVRELAGRLRKYFPSVDVQVDHGWSGVLGVTRDWCATVGFDKGSGTGAAFGYAGHGVTATNLAARTLVDLALGRDTPLVRLPLVDHRSPSWEPEPLRWLGIHGMYRLLRFADALEESRASANTSMLARVGARLAGLHE